MKTQFVIVAVAALAFVLADAACVDREDAEGGSGIEGWWSKAKCDLAATKDRVVEKAQIAYEATKDIASKGYEGAKVAVEDGVEKAKEGSKKLGSYLSETFTDEHKSSEENDDKTKVKAQLPSDGDASPAIDVRGQDIKSR